MALAKRLQNGDPPDVWQTFAGKSVQGYAARGSVRDVTSVAAGGDLRTTMQPTILQSLMRDGKPYGVPTGAHRSNVLWFNIDLLKKAGVTPPARDYTRRRVPADLAEGQGIRGHAPVPRRQGPVHHRRAVREHAAQHDRDARLAGHGRDDLDWRSARVQTALKTFGAMLAYADPEASGLTWDAATKKLATGGCAFESMNDSAYGELVAAGGQEGKDFGAAAFPGTDDSFLAVVDVFVAATKAKNAKNALAFLAASASPRRSSRSARPRARYRCYATSTSRRCPPTSRVLEGPLGVAGAAVRRPWRGHEPEFQEGFYDAVSTYVRTRDPGAFADDLQNAVSNDKIPPR